MDINETILKRFKELASEDVIPDPAANISVRRKAQTWQISSCDLLKRVFGEDSTHHQQFISLMNASNSSMEAVGADGSHTRIAQLKSVKLDNYHAMRGILDAAKRDYECGYTFSLERRLQVNMFGDLLEQAGQYLNHGISEERVDNIGVATIIAGCALEDGMRKLCKKHGISLKDDSNMGSMLQSLREPLNMDGLLFKEFKVIVDLRNLAAHGKWKELDPRRVENMISSITQFLAKYFRNDSPMQE